MITVITITYNRANYLGKAIQSVLSQTYSEFEYLIVDDGSTDDTEKLVRSFSDERIKYIRNSHTGFLSVNRNAGLKQAKGLIVTFLDSDDYWKNNHLEEIKIIYDDQKVNAVVTNAVIVSESGERPLMSGFSNDIKDDLLKFKLRNNNFIICSCCFSFRSEIDLRFNETMQAGDTDFYLRVLALGNAYFLNKKLAFSRQHDSNMSSPKTIDSPFIQAYNEEFITLDFLREKKIIGDILYRRSYSRYLSIQAGNLRQIGLKDSSRSGYLKAFLKYSFNIKALIKSLL